MREGRERGLVEIMFIEGNSGHMKIYKILYTDLQMSRYHLMYVTLCLYMHLCVTEPNCFLCWFLFDFPAP
jgi:hypothetical protein